jgi:hypothetical protein
MEKEFFSTYYAGINIHSYHKIRGKKQASQLLSENNSRTGSVVQPVVCLLCNYEALNSNPSSTKMRK